MHFNTKTRKRISFTPIMLTSKSMHPVDRSDYQLTRNQRKFSGAKQSRDELSHDILRLSSDLNHGSLHGLEASNNQGQIHKGSGSDELEDEGFKKLIRKMTTPTVVKVQFQDQLSKKKKKLLKKKKQQIDNENELSPPQKYMHLTNAKTFEQFTKIAKIQPSKRHIHILQNEIDQDWNKYLDSYYLNIRKVKPLLKKDFQFEQLIIQKKKSDHLDVKGNQELQDYRNSNELINIKLKQIRSRSKKQSRHQRKNQSHIKRGDSEDNIQMIPENSVYKKIQQDIILHKSNSHRKDYFVFGLSQTTGKIAEATIKNKFDSYKDFIFRVNFTNGIYVKPRQENDKSLKFYVGFGNNASIIKGIMRRRFWWQIVEKISDQTNFVWTQLKIKQFFKKQPKNISKMRSNRFSNHIFVKQSENQSENLSRRDINEKYNNVFCGNDLRIWERYQAKYQKCQQKGYDYTQIKRIGGLLKKKPIDFLQNHAKFRVHNHLQFNYFLGNKKALFYSLRKYYELLQKDPFTKIPVTFHITQGIQDPQFQRFLVQFQLQNNKRKIDKDFRNIWIIKPGQFTNRGRGITVCSTLDEIKNRLKSKQKNSDGTNRTFIVQKYIQRPLLYQRRKFDIRHYMVISCINGKIKGYWYLEGYIRTTSSQYNIKNTKNLFTHLTNDAVQKYGQDYGKYEKGNKISYAQFQKYLTNSLSSQIDFQNDILPKMKSLATDSIRATYSMLDPDKKQHNFQLFGLDFMLDENYNVFLIEVNTNPCLQTSCPLLTKIITPLIENLFKLCLDPLFPPPYEWPSQKKYNLGQNALQQNKFSIVFDQSQEGLQLKDLYRNTPRIDQKMGDIYQEDQQYQDQQKQWNDEEDNKK